MKHLTWMALTLAACAEPARMPPGDPDRDPDVEPLVSGCTAVSVHDTAALADGVASALGGTAIPHAQGDFTIIASVPLDPVDPIASALARLGQVLPLFADEYELIDPPPDLNTSLNNVSLRLRRSFIGDIAAPFAEQAFGISLLRDGQGGWKLGPFDVATHVVYVTHDEFAALAECTQHGQPDLATIRAHTFAGTTVSCAGSGDAYDYTPQATDAVAFTGDPVWRALDADGRELGARIQWHVVVPAQVLIDPANFGLLPPAADCRCDERAGYDLQLSTTNEVLLVVPGLGCVAC
jgi:hypothetical protein